MKQWVLVTLKCVPHETSGKTCQAENRNRSVKETGSLRIQFKTRHDKKIRHPADFWGDIFTLCRRKQILAIMQWTRLPGKKLRYCCALNFLRRQTSRGSFCHFKLSFSNTSVWLFDFFVPQSSLVFNCSNTNKNWQPYRFTIMLDRCA